MRTLLIRFSLNPYDDSKEALTKLRQVGIVEDYKSRFETLSNRLSGLSDTYKLSCFMSGLRDEIRLTIRMFNPSNLSIAYYLS